MAILIHLTRTQSSSCCLLLRKQLFSSFRRNAVIRRSMASDATATETTRFDFLVIGGGSGGLAGARRASELGAATAVIESHKLGGTCVSKNTIKHCYPFRPLSLCCGLCSFNTHVGCQVHCETSGLLLWKFFFCLQQTLFEF